MHQIFHRGYFLQNFEQNLGPVGSAYFWINKYCGDDEIVAIVDAADWLVGQQALKVMNWAYSTTDKWFAYSRFFISKNVT